MTRFTLRSLILFMTLAAIGLAFVGNQMIEVRRQERLLKEARRAADSDHNTLWSVGYSNGKIFVWLLGGELLSEATARTIIKAKRITWLRIDNKTRPTVQAILAEKFVRKKGDDATDWHREGSDTPPSQAEVWDYVEGEKRELGTPSTP